jgi:hypothetical protein
VDAVAIDARRDSYIAAGKPFSMHAGAIKRELVDALLWTKLVHQRCVAVTPGTQLGDSPAIDLSQESLSRVHGDFHVRAGRIASVAVCAGEAISPVDVGLDELSRPAKAVFQGGVAVKARVGLDRGTLGPPDSVESSEQQRNQNARPHLQYPNAENTAR